MNSVEELARHLRRSFPPERFTGVVAAHDCLECDELRHALGGKTWQEIDGQFLLENDGCLPLLTPDAYCSFLPAWIENALRDPEGSPAVMALINMEDGTHSSLFTPRQRTTLVECVEHVHAHDQFAFQDEESIARVAAIKAKWLP